MTCAPVDKAWSTKLAPENELLPMTKIFSAVFSEADIVQLLVTPKLENPSAYMNNSQNIAIMRTVRKAISGQRGASQFRATPRGQGKNRPVHSGMAAPFSIH